MKDKLKCSQLAHLRLRRENARKANSAKNGTANAYYGAKVEYHDEVKKMQEKRKKILSQGERRSLYFDFLRKHGVPKGYRVR
ncbi:MAG: hypothetical protein E7364_06755 [Clostridiales bacterium]|nr:hypothetical protein [Clostridiales bacterium]